jgi:para-nitrobenzyl esterase
MAARVQIRHGTLEGIKDRDVFKFLGIPYAAPSVGDLRWRTPQPPGAWNGIRQTKWFGPMCPKTVGASFDIRQTEESEDCLYLNIWTRSSEVNDKQPVTVWIHGGGNLGGAGSEDAVDGTHLASRGGNV